MNPFQNAVNLAHVQRACVSGAASCSSDNHTSAKISTVEGFRQSSEWSPTTWALGLSVVDILSIAQLIFVSGLYLLHFIGNIYARHKIRNRRYTNFTKESAPGVTVIKPIVGIDDNLECNLTSWFKLDYPKYELSFCFERSDDPALGLVKRLMRQNPLVPATIFTGGREVGANPKINNMQPAYDASRFEHILISDSSILASPESILDLVTAMDPETAIVTQTPFCNREMKCQGLSEWFGAIVERVYFGGAHARIYLSGNCLGFVCSTGMSCLLRRAALDPLGGLAPFGAFLAEDYFLGQALTRAGWKAAVSSLPACQNGAHPDIRRFVARITRWMQLRVTMLPQIILLEPAQDCFLAGLMSCFAAYRLFHVSPTLYFVLHCVFWALSDWILLRAVQGSKPPFTFAAFLVGWLAREALALPLYLRALFSRRVVWRDKEFRLRWGGRVDVHWSARKAQ